MTSVLTLYEVAPYLKRVGFRPCKQEHYGDGGAFPEIHYAQYPLNMGRDRKTGGTTLPVSVDKDGEVIYDAIVRQGDNRNRFVYSQYKDLIPKFLKGDEGDEEIDVDEKQKIIDETTRRTKESLEKKVNMRLSASQCQESKFIKYKPSQQSASFNSGAKERIIRMVEKQVDHLEPPKFKHKKVPRATGSPPVPVMHSPPRPVTVKDLQDWKIPPCISNWKNPKGYTIPLDKRLAADGRGVLQEVVRINSNFANFYESLCVAEQKARKAITMRAKVQKEMMMKEKERKEMELQELARKARSERIGIAPPSTAAPVPSESDADDKSADYERLQRDKIREERRLKRRFEAKDTATVKKSKITRDRDRDVSEKVALGMASTGTSRGEVMYDQRLFNQEKGMDSGFATDDAYNVYDKRLFTCAQPTLSTLYRPKKDIDSDTYGASEEQLEKIMKTDRFKPDKAFAGTSERAAPRDGAVEFDESDPFGLDKLWK